MRKADTAGAHRSSQVSRLGCNGHNRTTRAPQALLLSGLDGGGMRDGVEEATHGGTYEGWKEARELNSFSAGWTGAV